MKTIYTLATLFSAISATPSNSAKCATQCSFDKEGVITDYSKFLTHTCQDCMHANDVCYICDLCDTPCSLDVNGGTTDMKKFNSPEC